nr:uncharacterized protein LOC109179472 [Ipomoea batatas]
MEKNVFFKGCAHAIKMRSRALCSERSGSAQRRKRNKLAERKRQNDVEPSTATKVEVEHPVIDIAAEVEPLIAKVVNVEVQPCAAIAWVVLNDNVIEMITSNAL